MTRRRNRIIFICLGIMLVILAITNPSLKRFNDYATEHLVSRKFDRKFLESNLRCTQPHNIIIASKFYYYINDNGVDLEADYIGVLGFFIPIRVVAAE